MKAYFYSLLILVSFVGTLSVARTYSPSPRELQEAPFENQQDALKEVVQTMNRGLRAVQVPHQSCGEKSVQVASANSVVIWGVDSKGYQQRMISHPDYLKHNLQYLIDVAGWQSAHGGGLSLKK